MHPIFLKELKPYEKEHIKLRLDLGNDEFNILVDKLYDKRIVEKEENGLFIFKFVGIIQFKNRLICFLPKYVKNYNENSSIKLLMKLFMEYVRRETLDNDELELFGDLNNESKYNYLAVVDYIINDYLEYDLYSNDLKESELNGEGDISWNQTVEFLDAYILDDQVLYFDLYTEKISINEMDYIRQIHKHTLNICTNYLSKINFLDIFEYPDVNFDIDLEALGELPFILKKIESEMHIQFSDRKLKLLKLMYFLLSNSGGVDASESIVLYGTRTFYNVWEKVCGFVIGNEYNKFKKYIDKPKWIDFRTNKALYKDTLIPDILRKIDSEKMFFIFDAKYYKVPFDDNGNIINNVPGIQDITKQYLYEYALIKSMKLEEYNRYNLFVLPSEEENEVFGKVNLHFFSKLSDIYLLRVNSEDIYKMYIDQEKFNLSFFKFVSNSIETK